MVAVLIVAASGFAFMGAVALVRPDRITRQFGIMALDTDGRNEVRAVYGGFGLAVAAALVGAVLVPTWRLPVALAVAVALAGMVLGRVISVCIDRRVGRFPLFYGAVEGSTSLLLVVAALS